MNTPDFLSRSSSSASTASTSSTSSSFPSSPFFFGSPSLMAASPSVPLPFSIDSASSVSNLSPDMFLQLSGYPSDPLFPAPLQFLNRQVSFPFLPKAPFVPAAAAASSVPSASSSPLPSFSPVFQPYQYPMVCDHQSTICPRGSLCPFLHVDTFPFSSISPFYGSLVPSFNPYAIQGLAGFPVSSAAASAPSSSPPAGSSSSSSSSSSFARQQKKRRANLKQGASTPEESEDDLGSQSGQMKISRSVSPLSLAANQQISASSLSSASRIRSTIPCRDFLQGRCHRGEECRYLHSLPICRDFQNGRCKREGTCRYRHELPEAKDALASSQNEQIYELGTQALEFQMKQMQKSLSVATEPKEQVAAQFEAKLSAFKADFEENAKEKEEANAEGENGDMESHISPSPSSASLAAFTDDESSSSSAGESPCLSSASSVASSAATSPCSSPLSPESEKESFSQLGAAIIVPMGKEFPLLES